MERMNKIDEMLEFLVRNGSSCGLDDLCKNVNVPCQICEKTIGFLAKYDFVRMKDSRIEINPKIIRFIAEV